MDTGKLAWKLLFDDRIYSTPTVFKDTLYIGIKDGLFVCISESKGTKKWAFNLEGGISATPVVTKNGIAFVGTEKGVLYALDLKYDKCIMEVLH